MWSSSIGRLESQITPHVVARQTILFFQEEDTSISQLFIYSEKRKFESYWTMCSSYSKLRNWVILFFLSLNILMRTHSRSLDAFWLLWWVGLYFFAKISQEKATITGCIEDCQSQIRVVLFTGCFTTQSNNRIFSSQDIKHHFMKVIWHTTVLKLDKVFKNAWTQEMHLTAQVHFIQESLY